MPPDSLTPILLRFAADSALIRRLVAEDEGFRSLVEDYILTLNTLRRLKNLKPAKQNAITEYTSVLQDLEQEITTCLSRSRNASHPPEP